MSSFEDRDQTVLDAVAGRRPNSKNRIRANCPWCVMVVNKADRKQCLELHVETGHWKCYRCDSHGYIDEMPDDVASRAVTKSVEPAKSMNLPEGFVPLWKEDGQVSMLAAPARKYLKKDRIGVTAAIIEEARIGACVRGRYVGRVVVPIYKEGKLAGFMTRAWRKKHPRPYLYSEGLDRANTLYNEDALYVTSTEPVFVVEGIFDTFPFWPNAVAVLGKPSGAQVEMMLNARRPICVVMDGDAWLEGEVLARALRTRGKNAISLKLDAGVDPDEVAEEVITAARTAFRGAA